MNPSPERIVAEIRRLLDSLNEENYASVVNDLSQYFDYGTEESILLIETCLDHFDIYKEDLETKEVEPAIATLFRNMMEKPHFGMVFAGLMRNRSINEDIFENLSRALKLSVSEKVAFGLNVLDSEINDVKIAGLCFCMLQCEELCSLDTSVDDIQKVLRFLDQSEVPAKHVDSFMLMILQAWLNAHSHQILAEQSHKLKLLSEMDFHIKDPFETKKEKRSQLLLRVLDSWNQLSYRCGELRVKGVQLRPDVAFSLLMSCYRNAYQDPFPFATVCGNVWKNPESQLLFLKHAVSSPPEVFTFAHCKRKLEYADHKFRDNHASQLWLCLDLLDVLCQLAEKGHSPSVRLLLKFPLNNFPEVILLGMTHVNTPYNLLQHEVFSTVFPLLLKDASMNRIILCLWQENSSLFSRALNDALNLVLENMNRVVDVFHELKILLAVLDQVPMSLGIRLAALASRKNFIDLVEWLTSNLSASEDIFFEECRRFLKEVEKNSGEIWNIYKETAPTFSKILQMHTDLLSSNKLTEQMESLYVTCMHNIPKTGKNRDPDSLISELHADVKSEMPGSSSQRKGYVDERHENSLTFSSKSSPNKSASAQVSGTSNAFGSAISIKTLLDVPQLAPHIQPVNQSFFLTTHFQSLLPAAMAKAIDGLLSTVVQRTVSIATQTTIELVLKEYITESDENIHNASSLMVVYLAGNLSYVTCKERLRSKISTELRNSLQESNVASEIFENALQHVIDDKLESGCEFIEKAAAEKGLVLLKRELTQQLSVRRMQREGYSRFTSKVIGPSFTTRTAMEKFQILLEKLEIFIANDAKETEIQLVVAEVHAVIIKCICKDEAALAMAQIVFEGLYENVTNNTHVNARLVILTAICDISMLVGEELTSWVIYADDDRKFNMHITIGLIHSGLLNLPEYDVHMAKLIEAGKNRYATEFCVSLVKTLEASDARVISQLHNIVDALAKVINYHVAGDDDKGELKSSQPDNPLFHGQVYKLLVDFCQIRQRFGVNDETCAIYVLRLHRHVFSKADNMLDRFFCVLLELVVSYCPPSAGINSSPTQFHQEADPSCPHLMDVYTDLIFSVLRFHPVDQKLNKPSLFSKVLTLIEKFITKDANEKKASFTPRPYFRLFFNFFHNLGTLALVINDANFQVLTSISYSVHSLQPAKVPEFSYAWLELVCHEDFMQKLLNEDDQKGWPYFLRLLLDLLQFMEPLLRIGELTEPVRPLYEGILGVLLTLTNDFPEFLCYYYFSLCDVIGPHSVQLRNIILSAIPRNMRISNTPNLKVDLAAEMSQPPWILSEFDAALKSSNMKNDLDEYLMANPAESWFLSQLKYRLLLPSSEVEKYGTRYNVPLMNSLVLYVGTKAIQQLQASNTPYAASIARNLPLTNFSIAALNIFQTLVQDLDSEGRYVFFNSVANHLRYPNNHTRYFSFILLHLFTRINQEAIHEQITSILLQLLTNHPSGPHPWGALVTFVELTKNPSYNFWNLSFTKRDPEIERVFNSVSRFGGSLK